VLNLKPSVLPSEAQTFEQETQLLPPHGSGIGNMRLYQSKLKRVLVELGRQKEMVLPGERRG
jgi:hypothetical protein